MTPNEREQEILTLWQTENTFNTIQKDHEKLPPFIMYEGPPTANGKPGIHHVLTRTYKDVIARYKTMRGFYVNRKAGWDEHGLPVEIEVQKNLNLKTKADVENYGIEKFNKKCEESTKRYVDDWKTLTERMGYWLDFEQAYHTSDPSYIKKVWDILIQMSNKGLIYQDYKIVPWATDSQTVLSNAEVAQGYKEVTDTSAYVLFELEKDKFLLAWTTTPWTLPANMALAVNPELTYNLNEVDGKTIISLTQIGKPCGTIKGSNLVGKKYAHPFRQEMCKIHGASFVKEDKTGIVHIAPAFGEDDYQLYKSEMKDDIYCHVELDGSFNVTAPACLYGRKLNKSSNEIILDFLKNRDLLHATEEYKHEYPHNWRTGVPLIYYLRKSWFIKTTSLKLSEANEQVTWYPDNVKNGRFGQWLQGGKDWAISRERWWGTPLPFYKHKDGYIPLSPNTFHKPECDVPLGSGGLLNLEGLTRTPEVADCWLDSGCVPWAAYDNQQADIICEGVDQTRGWFYSLMCVGVSLTEQSPYKAAISLGHVLDKDGQKMSKSKGNAVDPWKVFEKYGADAVRWYMLRNTIGNPLLWNEEEVSKVNRVFFNRLLNCVKYWEENKPNNEGKSDPTDTWIFARSWELTKNVTELMDVYQFSKAAEAIEKFVDDLSNVWIRANRHRFVDGEQVASVTLFSVLRCISVLMSPFTPFLSEHIGKRLGYKTSVHASEWLQTPKELNEFQISSLANMEKAGEIVTIGMKLRDDNKIRVRQALSSISVPKSMNCSVEYEQFVKSELNVKSIVWTDEESITLDTEITLELKYDGMVRDLIRAIQAERKNMGLKREDRINLVIQAVETEAEAQDTVLVALQNRLDFYKHFCHSVSCNLIVYEKAEKLVKVGDKEVRFSVNKVN